MTNESKSANEAAWVIDFLRDKTSEIYLRARNPYDTQNSPQCFGVAQHVTLESDGRLLYHEGYAYDKITHAKLKHAWNTFQGEVVDLSMNLNVADGSIISGSDAYENYQSEHSYTVDQVRKVLTQRRGVLDWLYDPEYSEVTGHGPAELG